MYIYIIRYRLNSAFHCTYLDPVLYRTKIVFFVMVGIEYSEKCTKSLKHNALSFISQRTKENNVLSTGKEIQQKACAKREKAKKGSFVRETRRSNRLYLLICICVTDY